jgi:hypothetical protein
MIRKGSRVIVLDLRDTREAAGVVTGKVNWDRTYYRVLLDDGRVVTSERVRTE